MAGNNHWHTPETILRGLATMDAEVLEKAMQTRLEHAETSRLDPKTHALVNLAALVALDTPNAYGWCIEMADASGATEEEIVDVLMAVAPLVGLARTAEAAAEVAFVLGYDVEDDEEWEEEDGWEEEDDEDDGEEES